MGRQDGSKNRPKSGPKIGGVALGHINREPASVDLIHLLRDFIAWEPRKMLRDRAQGIMDRMLEEASEVGMHAGAETA